MTISWTVSMILELLEASRSLRSNQACTLSVLAAVEREMIALGGDQVTVIVEEDDVVRRGRPYSFPFWYSLDAPSVQVR